MARTRKGARPLTPAAAAWRRRIRRLPELLVQLEQRGFSAPTHSPLTPPAAKATGTHPRQPLPDCLETALAAASDLYQQLRPAIRARREPPYRVRWWVNRRHVARVLIVFERDPWTGEDRHLGMLSSGAAGSAIMHSDRRNRWTAADVADAILVYYGGQPTRTRGADAARKLKRWLTEQLASVPPTAVENKRP